MCRTMAFILRPSIHTYTLRCSGKPMSPAVTMFFHEQSNMISNCKDVCVPLWGVMVCHITNRKVVSNEPPSVHFRSLHIKGCPMS